MRTLKLGAHGLAVRSAQRVLNGANFLKADWLKGSVDGEFGRHTERAVMAAKFWIGYSTSSAAPVYGDKVHAFLTGAKPLSKIMRIRRKRRLLAAKRAAAKQTLGLKALKAAKSQVGYSESPAGSNNTKFGKWYGMNRVPWCAIFMSWAFRQAGSRFKYAYCPYIVSDARRGRNGLRVVSFSQVRPGDLALYNWDGDWDADHVGMVSSKINNREFLAVEGNTALGNDSNGGRVMVRRRSHWHVQAFVRVTR